MILKSTTLQPGFSKSLLFNPALHPAGKKKSAKSKLKTISLHACLFASFLPIFNKIKTLFRAGLHTLVLEKQSLKKRNDFLEHLVAVNKKQAEKLKNTLLLKEKILTLLSHDVRAPLNGVILLIDMCKEIPVPQAFFLDKIVEAKKDLVKIDSLVVDLLNWSANISATENKPISSAEIHCIAASVLSLYSLNAKNKMLTIFSDIDMPSNMSLTIARRELEIILRNLLSNAIKFSGKNSENVIISLKKTPGIQTMAVLTVKDSGTGMNAQTVARLNSSKAISTLGTENEAGMGIGLSIVFNVINEHNLQYNIQSAPGKGTEFSIYLPMIGH